MANTEPGSIRELLQAARTTVSGVAHSGDNTVEANRRASADAYVAVLAGLSSEERYSQLKGLNANQLFCDVLTLLPESQRDEFWWFEKRSELHSTLKHTVLLATILRLIDKGTDPLRSLVRQLADGDEFWLYHSIPGDSGYALVRGDVIVDFCTLDVWSV